jgi:hypothetical protein
MRSVPIITFVNKLNPDLDSRTGFSRAEWQKC